MVLREIGWVDVMGDGVGMVRGSGGEVVIGGGAGLWEVGAGVRGSGGGC